MNAQDISTRMGEDYCPHCNTLLDAATPTDNEPAVPNPGDLTVCIKCASILKYRSDMALEEVSVEEIKLLEPELIMQLSRVQMAIMATNRKMEAEKIKQN